MADKKINLQIITPSRVLCDEMVDMVIMRASTGDIGILPNHEPVVATLNYGILRYKQDGKEHRATIMSGFTEVEPDKVVILTDAAEWPEEIDLARAEEAKKRALERLKPKAKDQHNSLRAEIALKKALVRIDAKRY